METLSEKELRSKVVKVNLSDLIDVRQMMKNAIDETVNTEKDKYINEAYEIINDIMCEKITSLMNRKEYAKNLKKRIDKK